MTMTMPEPKGSDRIEWDALRLEARNYRELVHKFTQSDEPSLRTDEEDFAAKIRKYAAQEGISVRAVAEEIAQDFWN